MDRVVLVIRVPRWRHNAVTENRYNTSTVVGLVGLVGALADPFVVAGMAWVQHHTTVVFPEGYVSLLSRVLEVLAMVYSAHYHTTPADPPATS